MDIFDQKKLLTRIILLLVFLNLVTISLFIWKEIIHERQPNVSDNEGYKAVFSILQKELHLNESQAVQFSTIRGKFFTKESFLNQIIRDQKDSMNVAMFNKSTDASLVYLLAKKIADNEYKMELLRYDQAKELKAICTPEQQERFKNLVFEIRDYFKPENQSKRK